jgi:hypothetical protein
MQMEALLPAWRGEKVAVGVRAPRERPDCEFPKTVVEPWIENGDYEREAKGSFERKALGTMYGVMTLALTRVRGRINGLGPVKCLTGIRSEVEEVVRADVSVNTSYLS